MEDELTGIRPPEGTIGELPVGIHQSLSSKRMGGKSAREQEIAMRNAQDKLNKQK